MIRRVLSIICHVISGFFIYAVSLIAFVDDMSAGMKLIIMAIFLLPALMALGAGLALGGFRNWKRDTGIVLASASGVSAFVIFTILCLFLSPEFRETYPDTQLEFFSDYLTGVGAVAVSGIAGAALILNSRSERSRRTPWRG